MDKQKKSVYIETTIPSLATGRPSRDVIIAGKQASTILFWETERHKYNLYTSQYVVEECALGDAYAAQRRLRILENIPVIPKSEKAQDLAGEYQKLLKIPDRAKIDCFHLAICVAAEIDYLLSWNCTHLGMYTFLKIKEYNERHNLFTPLLFTPESLVEYSELHEMEKLL